VGTSIYEAGANTTSGNRQIAMGLAGVIIVRPATGCAVPVGGFAHCLYGDAATGGASVGTYNAATDAFDDEALVAISDIDPGFNAAPLTYDMSTFSPKYHLLNGKAFPDTEAIDATVGKVLALRYANLGSGEHTMGLIGPHQTVVGRDANALMHSHDVVTPLITAGQTADVSVAIPAAANVVAGQRYALYDQNRKLKNGAAAGIGGALTFINVWSTNTADLTALPVATLTPLANDVVAGSFDVTGCGPAAAQSGQFFIDQVGNGLPGAVAVTAATTGPCAGGTDVKLTVDSTLLDTLDNGSHIVFVQLALDNPGSAFGAAAGVAFTIDRNGPVMSATTVCSVVPDAAGTAPTTICPPLEGTPLDEELARTNDVGDLIIRTTADSSLTGNANVASAAFSAPAAADAHPDCAAIEAGGASALDVDPAGSPAAPTLAFIKTLTGAAAPLDLPYAEGKHFVKVAALDDKGHWSQDGNPPVPKCDEAAFIVDKTAPVTSGGSVNPPVSDGTQAANGNTNFLDSVRVDVHIEDPIAPATATGVNSNVVKAEGFIEGFTGTPIVIPATGVPAATPGTGFEFFPVNGDWTSSTTDAYAYVPLALVRSLSVGQHRIFIHAQDAAGNWGSLHDAAAPDAILDYEPAVAHLDAFRFFRTASGGTPAGTLRVDATPIITGNQLKALDCFVGFALPTTPTWTNVTTNNTVLPNIVDTITFNGPAPAACIPTATQNLWIRITAANGQPVIANLPVVGAINYAVNPSSTLVTSQTGDIANLQVAFAPLGSLGHTTPTPLVPSVAPANGWADVAGGAGPSPLVVSPLPNPTSATNLVAWYRAVDLQGNVGPAVAAPALGPVTFTGGRQLTVTSYSQVNTATSYTATAQYVVVSGAQNAPQFNGWNTLTLPLAASSPRTSTTVTVPNPAATVVNPTLWVRAIDNNGSYGEETSLPRINRASYNPNGGANAGALNVTLAAGGAAVQWAIAAPGAQPSAGTTITTGLNNIQLPTALTRGNVIWLRAISSGANGGASHGGFWVNILPTVTGSAPAIGVNTVLTNWTATARGGPVTAVEYSVGATAANPGAPTATAIPVAAGNAATKTFSLTVTTPAAGQHIWIRVRSGNGPNAVWGPALQV